MFLYFIAMLRPMMIAAAPMTACAWRSKAVPDRPLPCNIPRGKRPTIAGSLDWILASFLPAGLRIFFRSRPLKAMLVHHWSPLHLAPAIRKECRSFIAPEKEAVAWVRYTRLTWRHLREPG